MNGITILGALPGSPAAECGLKYGDVLLSVNGEAMSSVEDFLRVRATARDALDILVRRGNHVLEFTVRLAKDRVVTPVTAEQTMKHMQQLRMVPPVKREPLN